MTLRAAVVGCGSQGTLHAECLSAMGVDVVGVCDLDGSRANELADKVGAEPCTNYATMIARHTPQVVTVCTMASTHAPIVRAGIDVGAHVLCEKSFVLNVGEAVGLARQARERGVLLSVDFNMRFTSQARVLRRHLIESDLGRPLCARAWAKSETIPWWGRHYVTCESGGGAFASTAVHLADLALWLAGGPNPLAVSAGATRAYPSRRGLTAPDSADTSAYDADDLIGAFVRCEDNFWLIIEGSWVWDRQTYDYGLEMVTTGGQVELEPMRVSRDNGLNFDQLELEPPATLDLPASVCRSLAAFVETVEGDQSPDLVTIPEAILIQALTDALYESAATGSEVAIVDRWSEFATRPQRRIPIG